MAVPTVMSSFSEDGSKKPVNKQRNKTSAKQIGVMVTYFVGT
jgi:hypothetical protein